MNPSDDNVQQNQTIDDSSIKNSKIQMAQSSELISQTQQNAKVIHNYNNYFYQTIRTKLQTTSLKWKISVTAFSFLLATSLTCSARYLGWLQPLELKAFDLTLAIESKIRGEAEENKADPRILIVTIDDEDLQYQGVYREEDFKSKSLKIARKHSTQSISDVALKKLLIEIEKLEPIVVGFDIYHEEPIISALPEKLLSQDRFIVTCRNLPGLTWQKQPTPTPKDLSSKLNIQGLSDIFSDNDKIVRNHLVSANNEVTKSSCGIGYSLSFLTALRYLKEQDNFNSEYFLKQYTTSSLGFAPAGYYKNSDGIEKSSSIYPRQGTQVLLRYRSYPDVQTASAGKIIPLRKILQDGIDPRQFQQPKSGLIVLIGNISRNTDLGFNDYFLTPNNIEIPGVFLHAQMISQSISFALDKRSLISWLPQHQDILWITCWTLAGSILITSLLFFKCDRIVIALLMGNTVIILFILLPLCIGAMYIKQLWIPLIPPLIGLVSVQTLTFIMLYLYPSNSPRKS